MTLMNTATKFYKSYLFTVVLKEMKKLADVDYRRQARKLMKNIDWDKKRMLNRVGLTTYRPGRATLGTSLLLIAGAGIGALAAMSLAPMRGEDFRRNIKTKAGEFMHKGDLGQTQAAAEA